MQKNEVPQDDEKMLDGKTKELQYALDENGQYVAVKSVGWMPKNIVMQQAWEEVNENIETALKEIADGKKSPIYFFMHKHIMDIKLLAEYTGFWKLKVKRHLLPRVFKKLSDKELTIYKEVFQLSSIEELKNFDISKYQSRR
jgi:hypothetical protein